jgi:hypothetical protein
MTAPRRRRARTTTRLVWVAAGFAAVLACSSTTNTTPISLNYDRPVDIGFACYGGLRLTGGGSSNIDQPLTTSAMPTSACDIRSEQFEAGQTPPVPLGQETIIGQASGIAPVGWYGFILNNESGTVTVSQWDTKPANAFVGADVTTDDADPLTPGDNGITVGVNPVAIATSEEGCYELTANAGTCDLSALDITSALAFSPPARVDRLPITNANGVPILARPAAMVAQPGGGTIGVACPEQPTGLVYIAYPTCSLVAVVDVNTGQIQSGISFATGVPQLVDGTVTCPVDCADEGSAGSATAGSAVANAPQPVALDLFQDPRVNTMRMAVGARNSPTLTIVNLGSDTALPTSVSQVALEDDTLNHSLGITSVALTPQIGEGGSGGTIDDESAPGGQFQFIYGVGTDGTIHVADVLNLNQECDTEVDPRLLFTNTNVKFMSCMPVGNAATPRRRPGVTGPGIEFGSDSKPISATIIQANTYDGDTRSPPNTTPTTMIGYFAYVSASNGGVFIVNVADDYYGHVVDPSDPFITQLPLGLAHQVRDALPDRNESDQDHATCTNAGPSPTASTGNEASPRAPSPPTSTVPTSTNLANPNPPISTAKQGELPFFHHELCPGSAAADAAPVTEFEFAAPARDDGITFPDLMALPLDEIWTFTWEGELSADTTETAINGPIVRTGQLSVENAGGMDLIDETGPFCAAGVESFDIVQLDGCNPANDNTDCPAGMVCFVHPDSEVVGLGACMEPAEASGLADSCREYLTSLRIYTAAHSAAGDLLLIPRRHDLSVSPVDGCTSDTQCQDLANYQLRLPDADNPIDDTTPPDTHKWACAVDPTRKGFTGADGNPGASCTETCGSDADCDVGVVCEGGFCVEGAVPPQACVNAPQRYDLRAANAFVAIGAVTGYVSNMIADSSGNCIHDPNAHPFDIGRIPLTAPACNPAADPLTGLLPDGVTYDANPCELGSATPTAPDEPECLPQQFCETEVPTVFQAGTCNLNSVPTLGFRPTQGIRFHNRGMTFTLVDPTYPGDQLCIGDRLGSNGEVPIIPDGYQMSVEITAGFEPLTPTAIDPTLPIKVVRGPTESIWVIDEGNYISTTETEASARGKVFRVESVDIAIVSTLE